MREDNRDERIAAIRLLRNAIKMVEDPGSWPHAENPGEYLLADAMTYLAWGDTHNALAHIREYEERKTTEKMSWVFKEGEEYKKEMKAMRKFVRERMRKKTKNKNK
jgi:hypothetical protein